ncbi:MAG: 5-formyltetrahydrofolate cyclo-ligase [Paracoccaceae bacterium]
MEPIRTASPTCLLPEEAETRRDVMRWRKAQRLEMIAARQAMAVADRQLADAKISDALAAEVGMVIGLYWPFKGEPDLRVWAAQRRANGAQIALPVVVEKGQPLQFRLWRPEIKLERGVWDIPVPPPDAPVLHPDLIIAAVVGVDPAGFRLGYGGGFYDRTLAAERTAGHHARVVGIGFGFQALPTIFPLPHDIPMDRVVLA